MIEELIVYYIIICISYGLSTSIVMLPECIDIVKLQLETDTIYDNRGSFSSWLIKTGFTLGLMLLAPMFIYYHFRHPTGFKWALVTSLIADDKIKEEIWQDILQELRKDKNE